MYLVRTETIKSGIRTTWILFLWSIYFVRTKQVGSILFYFSTIQGRTLQNNAFSFGARRGLEPYHFKGVLSPWKMEGRQTFTRPKREKEKSVTAELEVTRGILLPGSFTSQPTAPEHLHDVLIWSCDWAGPRQFRRRVSSRPLENRRSWWMAEGRIGKWGSLSMEIRTRKHWPWQALVGRKRNWSCQFDAYGWCEQSSPTSGWSDPTTNGGTSSVVFGPQMPPPPMMPIPQTSPDPLAIY